MSDFETRLDDNLKTQEKLEKSFGKDMNIRDKSLLAEGMGKKGGEKEKFDINDLNEGIDTALQNKINRSMGNLGQNEGSKSLVEIQKMGLMDDIRNEQDPKKKIEMFQEIVDKINAVEGTAHAEMKKQEEHTNEASKNESRADMEKRDNFIEKLRLMKETMQEMMIKRIEGENRQKTEARNEGNNEQAKAKKEANEIGERLNMA